MTYDEDYGRNQDFYIAINLTCSLWKIVLNLFSLHWLYFHS